MIILLGARKKYDSLYLYLKEHKIDFKVFEAEPNNVNASSIITDIEFIGYKNFFDPSFYYNNNVSKVVNFRDQKKWLELENEISKHFDLPYIKQDTLNFYSYKTAQDIVCKKIGIPTIPNNNEKIIVKLDAGYSGGTDFKVIDRREYQSDENKFIQNFIDIDYTLAIHFYADMQGNTYPYCFHKITYEDNCPIQSITPVQDNETILLLEYLKKLKQEIHMQDRLCFWQFVKDKQGNLYNMDFNCRPAGGFENGSWDRDIANHNMFDYYILGKTFPSQIKFTNSVELIYNSKREFGYTEYQRTKNPIEEITLSQEITL